ncbi:MAG: acyl carrier protein [Proteobacteria bacterium]|nr:acyl carrier protein [Pseudomonadota bacterium]
MTEHEEIYEKMKEIIIDVFGVDDDEVLPEASLVDDLGAESIDFLDLSFRIEKEFGVRFPENEIADLADQSRQNRFAIINEMLKEDHHIELNEEEADVFSQLELSEILDRVREKHNVVVSNAEIEKANERFVIQMANHLNSFGVDIDLQKNANLSSSAIELDPMQLRAEIVPEFTVQFLVDFVKNNMKKS